MKVLQGVGAASVEYLVHSPMIRQSHFQRVILMSGSMFSSWSRVHNPSDRAARLATALGCPLPADLHTHHTNTSQPHLSKLLIRNATIRNNKF